MAATQLHAVLQKVRRTVLVRDSGRLTDGELLESFIVDRDEAAFEAIVRRHGPMVLGVCRRVLRNRDDADDAFQATFLVLVRKAESVRPRDKVGHWLYGVARTTAIRARALAARRRRQERQVLDLPEAEARPEAGEPWGDWQPLLDEELGRLPEKYRAPIVLCDLENRTIKEAAHTLAWPPGTVAGRLARGRKVLARRLTRRGMVVSASALAASVLDNAASARVPAALVAHTMGLVHRAAGPVLAEGPVSGKVLALTKGVIQTMTWKKLRMAALVLGCLGLSAGSGAFYLRPAAAQQPPALAHAKPHRNQPAEPKQYEVAIRLMEALLRPTPFHSEREVLEFPRMLMADDAPIQVWIGENRKGFVESSVLPLPEDKSARSLRTSIHHLPSGKVAVKLAYRQEPALEKHGEHRSTAIVRNVAGEVVPGQVSKLPLRPGSKDQPRQWLEVVVSTAVDPGCLRPPDRAHVYTIHLNLTEPRTGSVKTLATPTLQVPEGEQAQFFMGPQAAHDDEAADGARLSCTARVNTLPDGRLRLDMRVERAEKLPVGPDELHVRARTLHVIKRVRPEEKVNLELESSGKASHPTRVQVVVSQVAP